MVVYCNKTKHMFSLEKMCLGLWKITSNR